MIREMGSRTQLLEWVAYANNEPFGDRRRDYHAAQIVAMFANLRRNQKRYPNPLPVSDFLLTFDEVKEAAKAAKLPPPTKRDWREIKAIAEMCSIIYNVENERAERIAAKRKKVNG